MQKLLLPEERLDILRAADAERSWSSLDDKRNCILCNRVITGRQIEITRDRQGHYFLQCPTPGCTSNIIHWYFCGLSPAQDSGPHDILQHEFSFFFPKTIGG